MFGNKKNILGHGVLCLTVAMTILVSSTRIYGQDIAGVEDQKTPIPKVFSVLVEVQRDEEAFALAWDAARRELTDADLKRLLIQADAEDGTLLADLILLAPDLDIMPSGDEGPGDFILVMHAAAMKRESHAKIKSKEFLSLDNWHDESVAWLREVWDGLSPHEPSGGVAMRHLVMLAGFSSNQNRMFLVTNDGIPFTTAYYQRNTSVLIAKQSLEDVSFWTSIATLPPAQASWADRCLVDYFFQYLNPLIQQQHMPEQVKKLYRQADSSKGLNQWLGYVSFMPPKELSEGGILGVTNEDLRWRSINKESPVIVSGEVTIPEIDWKQWSATGLCLVATDDGKFLLNPDPRYAPADKLEIPVLLIVNKQRVFLCLPGEAPIDFGKFVLPVEE